MLNTTSARGTTSLGLTVASGAEEGVDRDRMVLQKAEGGEI